MLRCVVLLCFSTASNCIKIQSKNLDHGECTFVRVDKVVIGLIFWNFIGMLDVWSLLQKKCNISWLFYYDSVQLLKFCESD
jgi:hypothetical protein